MNTSKQTVVAVAVLAMAGWTMQLPGPAQAASQKPSNTRRMRCVVKVSADADILPISFDILDSLLRSDAVAAKAAGTAWPAGHGAPDEYFEVRPLRHSDPEGESVSDNAPADTEGRPPATAPTVMFELRVHLTGDVVPAAREFGNALIENLRAELREGFDVHLADLRRQLGEAEAQREAIRKELDDMLRQSTFGPTEDLGPEPADGAVYEQLEKIVDLSRLTPQMPAQEAFDLLRNSVQPPLNLVVLWRDLTENAYVDVTSPIEMDGLPNVRLGTALENLLSALSDPLATTQKYRIDYRVDNGVVTIATRLRLPAKRTETRVYELPPLLRAGNQAPEIAAMIREIIEPESWHDLYLGLGEGTVTSSPDGRLIVSQRRDVHIKIQELLARVATRSFVTLPTEASQKTLAERMEALMPYREQLEQELDRLQERQTRIAREKDEKSKRSMEEALRATSSDLFMVAEALRRIHEDLVKTGTAGAHAEEIQRIIGRIKQCMNRDHKALPIHQDLGWEVFPPYGDVEKTLAERVAAKQKDLREVSRRIAETQRATTGAKTFDTELSRAQRMARQREQADARAHDLKTRMATLRPCTVTIIGGME